MGNDNLQKFQELKQLINSAESARAAAERILLAFPNAGHEASILLGRAWVLFSEFYEKHTGKKLTNGYTTNLNLLSNTTIDDLTKEMHTLASYKLAEVGKCSLSQGHLEELCVFFEYEFRSALTELKKEYNINFWNYKYRNHIFAAIACLLACILAIPLFFYLSPKPWRISYFPNTTLSGKPSFTEIGSEPTEGALSRAKAHLQRKGQLRGEGFSAKYEGCLKLDSEKDINWSLGSDDGSRLFIDNKEIINNWGAHALITKTARQHLTAGTHTIKIEFFDNGGSAVLNLKIKGDNKKLLKSIRAASENGQCK